GLRKGSAIEVGGAVFSLPEPAGRRDTEDVQVVFDAATDEPATTIERRCRRGKWASQRPGKRRSRPVRLRITSVDVGQDIRSDQITHPCACGPSVLQLYVSGKVVQGVVDRAAKAAEDPIGENTGNPRAVELPVIPGT